MNKQLISMLLAATNAVLPLVNASQEGEDEKFSQLLCSQTQLILEFVRVLETNPQLYREVDKLFSQYGHSLGMVKMYCNTFLSRVQARS